MAARTGLYVAIGIAAFIGLLGLILGSIALATKSDGSRGPAGTPGTATVRTYKAHFVGETRDDIENTQTGFLRWPEGTALVDANVPSRIASDGEASLALQEKAVTFVGAEDDSLTVSANNRALTLPAVPYTGSYAVNLHIRDHITAFPEEALALTVGPDSVTIEAESDNRKALTWCRILVADAEDGTVFMNIPRLLLNRPEAPSSFTEDVIGTGLYAGTATLSLTAGQRLSLYMLRGQFEAGAAVCNQSLSLNDFNSWVDLTFLG